MKRAMAGLATACVVVTGLAVPRQDPERVKAIAATPIVPLDDSIYTNQDVEVWGPISGRRCRSILPLAFAECLENKGRFLPSLIARLDAIAAQSTWMNPYHDRPHFGNFFGTYSTVPGRTEPTRFAIVLDEPATDAAVTLRFTPGEITVK